MPGNTWSTPVPVEFVTGRVNNVAYEEKIQIPIQALDAEDELVEFLTSYLCLINHMNAWKDNLDRPKFNIQVTHVRPTNDGKLSAYVQRV